MEILIEGQLDYLEERSWKKRYFVMKYEISSALRYIEIYKDKNWQKQLPRHVVNLHPGYEVRRKDDPKKKYCFSLQTTDHTLLLATEDENNMTNWMTTLEEYNLVRSFYVQPQDTPTMARIEAVFPCHLQLVHSEVRLVSAMDGKLLGLWPFRCIRRYKFVGNLFSIEAGRKAATGEGIFEFISSECSEIYRVMDTIIRAKAGKTTMRRLASEKLQNQVEQGHPPVRKTSSVPISPTKTAEPYNYDYASPVNIPSSRPPPPPPLPLSNPPEFVPEGDPRYDILCSGSDLGKDVESPKQSGKTASGSAYNTLQFANAHSDEAQSSPKVPGMTSSLGSYDTLNFSAIRDEQELKKDGSYDTLQFRAKKDAPLFSVEEKQQMNHKAQPTSSGSFYDTLNHSSVSVSGGSGKHSDAYDTLNGSAKPPSSSEDTYDSIDNSRAVVPSGSPNMESTYNALSQQKPNGKISPVQGVSPPRPTRPPPRMKPPSIAKHPENTSGKSDKPVRKILQPDGPVKKLAGKPVKPIRKNVPVIETEQKSKPESIADVIQKRLAISQQSEDDGSYASVDHEYTSIDYSKVAKPESNLSSNIYSEPHENIEAHSTSTTINKAVAKPTKSKPPRNLFKKPPIVPKPKIDAEGNFADELKKKLKQKKEAGCTLDTARKASQSDNDDIYDEVDV